MKFRYKLPAWILVFLIALTVAESATTIYFLLKILNVAGLTSNSLLLEIAMTIICVLGIIFSVFLLSLHYKISETHFELRLAFFDILKKQVLISKICNVVYKKEQHLLLLSYISTALDPVIMIVAVNVQKADIFAAALKSINPKIIYTVE